MKILLEKIFSYPTSTSQNMHPLQVLLSRRQPEIQYKDHEIHSFCKCGSLLQLIHDIYYYFRVDSATRFLSGRWESKLMIILQSVGYWGCQSSCLTAKPDALGGFHHLGSQIVLMFALIIHSSQTEKISGHPHRVEALMIPYKMLRFLLP